jgi:hypothetical protein
MSSTEIRAFIEKGDLEGLKRYFDLKDWNFMVKEGYFDFKYYEKKIT